MTELTQLRKFSAIARSIRENNLDMNKEDKQLEAAAEQWVNIVFAQLEVKKQDKQSPSNNKVEEDGRLFTKD